MGTFFCAPPPHVVDRFYIALFSALKQTRCAPSPPTPTHKQGIQSPEEKRWVLRADLNDAMEEDYQIE